MTRPGHRFAIIPNRSSSTCQESPRNDHFLRVGLHCPDALIRKTAPDAAESIQYGMPSYTLGEMLHFLVLELGAALAPCHLVDAGIVLQRVHAGDVVVVGVLVAPDDPAALV